jgi:hypothetical protein
VAEARNHRTQKVIQGDDNGHVGRPCEVTVSLAPPYPGTRDRVGFWVSFWIGSDWPIWWYFGKKQKINQNKSLF